MAKHALIGGGTGFIGRNLTEKLVNHGYDITVVSRMPGPRHITWLELEKNGIPNGVTSVVNLTGQNVLDPTRRWTAGFKQNCWNSRVNSSAALVRAVAAEPKVRVFVNINGVSNYRPCGEKVYTEEEEGEDYDFMSKLSLAWEKAATLPTDVAQRCRGVKIRTGVVVGRGGGMIQSIWLPFKLGLGGPMGTGQQILPWIHMDDLCRLIQHCFENEKCVGVLNGVAPEIVTNAQFSKIFASAMFRPCLIPVPEAIVHMIFGADRAALLLTGARIEPKRTLETGFEFKYPTVKQACQELMR